MGTFPFFEDFARVFLGPGPSVFFLDPLVAPESFIHFPTRYWLFLRVCRPTFLVPSFLLRGGPPPSRGKYGSPVP